MWAALVNHQAYHAIYREAESGSTSKPFVFLLPLSENVDRQAYSLYTSGHQLLSDVAGLYAAGVSATVRGSIPFITDRSQQLIGKLVHLTKDMRYIAETLNEFSKIQGLK
jgi:hypothetical protein